MDFTNGDVSFPLQEKERKSGRAEGRNWSLLVGQAALHRHSV